MHGISYFSGCTYTERSKRFNIFLAGFVFCSEMDNLEKSQIKVGADWIFGFKHPPLEDLQLRTCEPICVNISRRFVYTWFLHFVSLVWYLHSWACSSDFNITAALLSIRMYSITNFKWKREYCGEIDDYPKRHTRHCKHFDLMI